MNTRASVGFGLASLAPVVWLGLLGSLGSSTAACSSSSAAGTGGPGVDSGLDSPSPRADAPADTSPPSDAHDAGSGQEGHDGGEDAADASDEAVAPVPAPGSVAITQFITSVVGLTSDDYLAFYDATGGVSVTDVTGAITQIAPGVTGDAGLGPKAEVLGRYVFIVTDYTTTVSDGVVVPLVGTLSIWTHSLNQRTEVATGFSAVLAVAADSSAFAYTHAVDPTGSDGTIAVAGPSGTGGIDLLSSVRVPLTSATCAPNVAFDEKRAVVSSCTGGSSTPSVSAFDGASAWSATPLTTSAGASSPDYDDVFNFTSDTVGLNVLVEDNSAPPRLSLQSLAGNASVAVGVLAQDTGSYIPFYLSADSSFALFTDVFGAIDKASFATPSALTAPVVTTLRGGDAGSGNFQILAVSPDDRYEIDSNSAQFDPSTRAPLAMSIRDLATAIGTPLVPGNDSPSFPVSYAGTSPFTADSAYALYGTAFKPVRNAAGTFVMDLGKLEAVNCATGVIHELVSEPVVPYAFPTALTGSKVIYSQNFRLTSNPDAVNGAATADLYTADAAVAAPGELLVAGADVYFFLTADHSHVFYTLSHVAADGDASIPLTGDGLYSVAVP